MTHHAVVIQRLLDSTTKRLVHMQVIVAPYCAVSQQTRQSLLLVVMGLLLPQPKSLNRRQRCPAGRIADIRKTLMQCGMLWHVKQKLYVSRSRVYRQQCSQRSLRKAMCRRRRCRNTLPAATFFCRVWFPVCLAQLLNSPYIPLLCLAQILPAPVDWQDVSLICSDLLLAQ